MKNIILITVLFFFFCNKEGINEYVNSIEYDPITSLELMLLNDFTYDSIAQTSTNYDEIKKVLEKRMAQNDITKENKLIWLGISKNNNNLTYVVRKKSSNSNILSIISRGTIFSLIDIIEDIDAYELVNWSDKVSPDIKISQGGSFALETTMSLTSKVYGLSKLGNNELTLKELLTKEVINNPNTTVYVTGYSLGGALTTGIALKIAEDFYDYFRKGQLSLSAYNFAGQTIGNNYFKSYYDIFLSNKSISFSYNRIINPYDAVPFAFNNLEGIKNIGYPYSEAGLLEVEALIASINIAFSLKSKKYTHVGGPPIKLLRATLPPPNCKDTVNNLVTFSCWATYEHQPFYYVDLLKTATNKE